MFFLSTKYLLLYPIKIEMFNKSLVNVFNFEILFQKRKLLKQIGYLKQTWMLKSIFLL